MLALMLALVGTIPSAVWAKEETQPNGTEQTGVTVEVTEASDLEALKAFLQKEEVPKSFELTKEQAAAAKLQMKFAGLKEKIMVGQVITAPLGIYNSDQKLLGIMKDSAEVTITAEPKELVDSTDKGLTVKKIGTINLKASWGELSAAGTITAECNHPQENKKITVTQKATCEKDGIQVISCDLCGEKLGQEIIKATGHQFGEWTVTKEATWDQAGEETRTCSQCQKPDNREIPALKATHEHDFSGEETIQKEATCTEEGVKVVKCADSRCDAVDEQTIPKKEHTFGEWTVTKEATWDQAGEETRICSQCKAPDKREIPALKATHKHDFSGEETIVKEPTCQEEGIKSVKCTDPRCNEQEKVSIAKTPHTFGEWTVTKEATWTEEGSRERICTVCKEKEIETIIALSVGHQHDFSGKEEIKKEPTCLDKGIKVIHCTTEECPEVKEEEIPALGHKWGEWKTEKEATCLEKGIRVRTCTVCQEKETEEIPLAAHKEGQWKVIKEATCRDTGTKILPCAVCDKTLKEAEIAKLEHKWGKWKVTKEATEKAKGEKEAVCQVCGTKKTEEIPKLEKPEEVKPNVPKTDDPMEPSLWIAMGIIAAAAIIILVFMGRKFSGHGRKI